VIYKSRLIFCRPIESVDKIGRFYRSSVIGLKMGFFDKIKNVTIVNMFK